MGINMLLLLEKDPMMCVRGCTVTTIPLDSESTHNATRKHGSVKWLNCLSAYSVSKYIQDGHFYSNSILLLFYWHPESLHRELWNPKMILVCRFHKYWEHKYMKATLLQIKTERWTCCFLCMCASPVSAHAGCHGRSHWGRWRSHN